MEFNERIILTRKGRNLSQEALAELVGVSRQAVSKWETGEAKPDADKLMALCLALDVSMDYLCFGKEPSPSSPAPKKELPKAAAILLTFFAGIAVFFTGLLASGLVFSVDTDTIHDAAYSDYNDYELMLDTITIVDAQPSRIIGQRKIRITVTPGSVPEGMTVKLMWIDQYDPNAQPSVVTCEATDPYRFSAVINHSRGGFSYKVSAVLQMGDDQKVIPILIVEGDGDISGLSWQTLLES